MLLKDEDYCWFLCLSILAFLKGKLSIQVLLVKLFLHVFFSFTYVCIGVVFADKLTSVVIPVAGFNAPIVGVPEGVE